jgi:hypothetical protein
LRVTGHGEPHDGEGMTRLPVVAATFVTLLTLVTLAVATADSKTPPGKAAPANTSPPSISGTPAVGSTLQASSGSWQGRSISYSYQWQRCSSGSCAAISGKTGSSYLVDSADVGDTLRVAVTAKNKFGSTTATSAQTAAVPSTSSGSTGYTNTALPSISGTAQAGQTLTVSNGSWSPTASSFQYAWERCKNGSCAVSPTSASRASYAVQSGDVGYTIVAEVAPAGVWSDSADTQPTDTVTNPPTPTSGSADFDGRAKLMTSLFSYEKTAGDVTTLQQSQSPSIWTCLCFENNDISLTSDSRYGQAYKATVPIGDSNPWNKSAPTTNGAAQMSVRRNNDLGNWDYYALAVKVPSWSGLSSLTFATLLSVGYQTSQGDQVGLGLINDNGQLAFQVHQNSGYENYPTTTKPAVCYKAALMPVVYGQWQEFVLAVKWATDNTGAVQVYSRTPGSSWAKVFERLNTPTYIYGSTAYGSFAADGSNWGTVIDKLGLYYGESGVTPTETVYESGVTRSGDLATAESTLP